MLLLDVSSEIRFIKADSICLLVDIFYSLWLFFFKFGLLFSSWSCWCLYRSSVLRLFLLLTRVPFFFFIPQKSLFTGSLAVKHTVVLWPEEILDGIGKQKCLPIMLYRVQQMDLWEIIGSFKFHPFVNFTLPPAAHQCLPEPTEKPAAQQGSWITENSLAELPPLQNGGFLRRQWVLSGFPKLEASFFLIACWGLGPHENTHTPCFTSV